MTAHRRWMLYVPELEPAGFFFFFFKGDTGRSYSLRRYADAHRPPALRTQRDFPHAAQTILAMATHRVEVPAHPVGDVAHWRRRTAECESKFLGRAPEDAPRESRVERVLLPASLAVAVAPEAHGGPFVSKDDRPLRTLEDWRAQHPARHWRAGYSAMELARAWSQPNGLPESFRSAFDRPPFAGLRVERAVVEHETQVPGRGRPSCTDLMVFARTDSGDSVVIGVEGKVDESFGPRVGDWRKSGETDAHRDNRNHRLTGLCDALELDPGRIDDLRYQLLHRAYSAVATARESGADVAVLAVHSLEGRGPRGRNWLDFRAFCLAMGGAEMRGAEPVLIGRRFGTALWVVWVTEGSSDRRGSGTRPLEPSLGAGVGVVAEVPSIFSGVDAYIDGFFGLCDVGKAPHHKHKTSALRLSKANPGGLDPKCFLGDLYALVERNGLASKRDAPSRENWRLEKKTEISPRNRSPETRLEKAIVGDLGDTWTNQMPTASGLVTSHERKRNIDLVHRVGPRAFEFIELKVGSDTPLFAAMEILKYGMNYLYSRRHRERLGYQEDGQAPLWADTVHLRVLAPAGYYRGFELGWLEGFLNRGLGALLDPALDGALTMDVRFEKFPPGFDPAARGQRLVDGLEHVEGVWA